MSSCNSNSRAACQRSQSQICRWTCGRGIRRRSFRGGKSPARTASTGLLLALLPLLPHQKTVGQHHRHRVAVKPRPQSTLILVPTQELLGLLMVLLHPVSPVRVFHQRRQRRPWPQVTPVVLAVRRWISAGLFADQPTLAALASGLHPPTTQGHKASLQPTFAALTPADRAPSV